MSFKSWILFLSAASLFVMVSCGKPSSSSVTAAHSQAQGTNVQVFQVKGTVKELQSDGKTVEIRHEEIPNYMPTMTMPFEAKNPAELKDLKPRDRAAVCAFPAEVKFHLEKGNALGTPVSSR